MIFSFLPKVQYLYRPVQRFLSTDFIEIAAFKLLVVTEEEENRPICIALCISPSIIFVVQIRNLNRSKVVFFIWRPCKKKLISPFFFDCFLKVFQTVNFAGLSLCQFFFFKCYSGFSKNELSLVFALYAAILSA